MSYLGHLNGYCSAHITQFSYCLKWCEACGEGICYFIILYIYLSHVSRSSDGFKLSADDQKWKEQISNGSHRTQPSNEMHMIWEGTVLILISLHTIHVSKSREPKRHNSNSEVTRLFVGVSQRTTSLPSCDFIRPPTRDIRNFIQYNNFKFKAKQRFL